MVWNESVVKYQSKSFYHEIDFNILLLAYVFICIPFQSPQDAVTPFQILGGEAQIVQVLKY